MGKSVEEIFSYASELYENERAHLAGLLLQSIDTETRDFVIRRKDNKAMQSDQPAPGMPVPHPLPACV